MDALNNMTGNVPSWLTRLDELSGQVQKRQAELASIAAAEQSSSSTPATDTKSLRNKGSTESLKPKDDGPANIPAPPPDVVAKPTPEPEAAEVADSRPTQSTATTTTKKTTAAAAAAAAATTTPQDGQQQQQQKPSTPPAGSGPGTLPSSHRPQRDATAAANSRAKAQIRKKVKTTSIMSVENPTPTYRTRSMIMVYYDSYVQGFFDELVRFVSSSRNMLRKAKMAAKVAHIRKMASAEGDGDDGLEPLPSLRYMSARRMGAGVGGSPGIPGSAGLGDGKPDVYDKLDKGLEHVQATCEHGAHQFLRDADCDEEIKKIKERLREVLDMAVAETERIHSEESERTSEVAADDVTVAAKQRTQRPVSIRRELSKDSGAVAAGGKPTRSINSESSYIEPAVNAIEADSGDEAIDIDAVMPKLNYRSTRGLRVTRPQ
ncbi:hypothetical protein GMORB2_4078 [Geosmithia morbida]|uniref:Uncharacterized protein n=1 Tax=Geosmithia morbida TaxID=1094350 RepID=A0A9P5D873_9HYPO|nr:uncharacterized protein GMORB2_4078 [Geosmithia morbida]KAF4125239.1 hypothetical protein GMORB2_4078 [Geosmithia morbida]